MYIPPGKFSNQQIATKMKHWNIIQLTVINLVVLCNCSNFDQALIDACYNGDITAVTSALGNGANIEARDYDTAYTPLAMAAANGNVDILKLLIDRGANIEARSLSMDTAIMAAAFTGSNETLSELIKRGVNINAKNAMGSTALITASFSGQLDVVEALVNAGADVSVVNTLGGTALSSAEYSGYSNIERYLSGSSPSGQPSTPASSGSRSTYLLQITPALMAPFVVLHSNCD